MSGLNQYEDIIPLGSITDDYGGKTGTVYWDPAKTSNQIAISMIGARRGRRLNAPHGAIISDDDETSSRFMGNLYESITANTHHPGLIVIGRDDRPIDDLTSVIYEVNGRIRLMEHNNVDDWGLMPRDTNPDPGLYVLINYDGLSDEERSIVTSILRLGRATHVFAFLSVLSIEQVTAEDADNLGIKIFTSSPDGPIVSYLGEDIPVTF